jgi:hypothetical protein
MRKGSSYLLARLPGAGLLIEAYEDIFSIEPMGFLIQDGLEASII